MNLSFLDVAPEPVGGGSPWLIIAIVAALAVAAAVLLFRAKKK